MTKNRKRRQNTRPNKPIPTQSNGHNSSKSTVLLTRDNVTIRTPNTVDNLNKLLDADSVNNSDDDDDFEYVDADEKSNRLRKIWLMLVGLVILGWLIAQAFNGFKQYQVKDLPTQQVINSNPEPTPKETPQEKFTDTNKSINQGLSEKESYFDLAQQGYEQIIADYVGANGQRLYMDAIKEQSKGRSAYRILLQKQAVIIKQHELLISKNESLSVANQDVMRLIGISLDAQSILNALQRLCQSKKVCDGQQDFNDFTVPSADALVNLRMYQNEEITEFTRGQEFQVRKQIIEEDARRKPEVKPTQQSTKAPVKDEKGGKQTNNNNAGIQRNS